MTYGAFQQCDNVTINLVIESDQSDTVPIVHEFHGRVEITVAKLQ